MSASTAIFYILSTLIVVGAILAVVERKIFRAAVYLLFSLLGIAGLYFYLNYEFLGAVQIVVYVGGIIVLIIFSILLTAESGKDMKKPAFKRSIFSALSVLSGTALTLWIIINHTFKKNSPTMTEPGIKEIGRQLLSVTDHGYILPFEVVSILLLVAMIGCIVIAIKVKPEA